MLRSDQIKSEEEHSFHGANFDPWTIHDYFLTPSPTLPCLLYLTIKRFHVYIAPSRTFSCHFCYLTVYNVTTINMVHVIHRQCLYLWLPKANQVPLMDTDQPLLTSWAPNVSKDENLTHLLDSFHRDRPKGRRGIPSWNLSLVLHQLTKAPFEPLKEASLKHLTFKTVFLLALGSGKRRSEIHAWLHKNIRHQSDWSKVSLYPSPSFLSKNQLAKEGPDSVAPVVIPALAPTLDKVLKGDRSLCPVRALRYYLDRTSDLRQNKELVFVSFKKGFGKDISPATISSWIKQTMILCYELSDQEALTLHQVKAHDVRAFSTSKAFQSGVSLEQILSACHWKSHNTFTQFYLKDVTWADTELFHLGPVVAAKQVHHHHTQK